MPFSRHLLLILTATLLAAFAAFGQEKAVETEVVATQCWSYGIQAGRRIVSDGTRIYVATNEARIDAVALDGRKLWSSELGGEVASNLLVTDDGLFVASAATSSDSKSVTASLRLLSRDTGITSQTIKLPDAAQHFLNTSNGSMLIVSENGSIQSIDVKSGAVRWKREVAERFVGEPYFGSERLIAASTAKQVFTLSYASGEIESLRKLPSQSMSVLLTAAGDTVIGDERGGISLYLVGKDGDRWWRYNSGAAISSVRFVGGSILAASNDNFIYMLTPRSGNLLWKKRFAGKVTQIGILDNTLAVVSSIEESGAAFVSLGSGRQLGQITLDDGEFLAASPVKSSGLVVVLTNNRLLAYSLNGCPPAKESGLGQAPKPQITKN